MKLGKVWAIILMVLVALTSLVSCNNEISVEQAGTSSISFAPSINKALNEKGEENNAVTQDVSAYYWNYYCSPTIPTRDSNSSFDALEWKAFSGVDGKGLGKIESLVKGENYYFGLRGYSNSAKTDLVWEGFHYQNGNAGQTTDAFEAVKLTSKTQLITIDVYTAGVGRLFFDMQAPAVNGFGVDDANFKKEGVIQYDYFSYTLSSIDGSNPTTPTDLKVTFTGTEVSGTNYGYYNSSDDTFYYSDISGSGADLAAGTYLMTIWQNSFDKDATDTANPYGQYKQVSQRKQVLIVNIVPGLNTVVSGSLDSTALDVLNYDANLGLDVIFHKSDASKVAALNVTVSNSATPAEKKIVYENDRVKVKNGDYVILSWTSNTDVNIYVNGDKLNLSLTDSRTDFGSAIAFYQRENSTAFTYVANLIAPGDVNSTVKAYGKEGTDYIVTIESIADDINDSESMSFTIVGIGSSDTISHSYSAIKQSELTSGTDLVTLQTESGSNTTIEVASINKSTALKVLQSMTGYTEDANNTLALTLSVLETDKTENSASFEIDLTAKAYFASTDTTSDTTSVKTLDDYVQASMEIEKGLNVLHVYHSNGSTKYEMPRVTDLSAAVSETNKGTEEEPFYVGVYMYDAETGVITIKTRSFSPFEIEYTPCEAKIGDKFCGTFETALKTVKDGETIEILKDCTYTDVQFEVADKSFTIDGNGHKMTATYSNESDTHSIFLNLENTKKITTVDIVDLSIVAKGYRYAIVYNSDNSGNYTVNGSMSNCTVECTGCAIGVSGNDYGDSEVNLYDCTVKHIAPDTATTFLNCAIAPQYDGKINVYGGSYESTQYVGYIYSTGGILNVYSGNFNVTGTAEDKAVLFAQCNNSVSTVHNAAEINVYGGTFDGALKTYSTENQPATIVIEGGTFNNVVFGTSAKSENAYSYTEISGGVFDADPTTYLATGCVAESNTPSANHWKVTTSTVENDLLITKSGETSTWMSLADFRDAVNEGNSYEGYTVILMRDVNLSSVANWEPIGTYENPFSGKFDGNGKTISNITLEDTKTEEESAGSYDVEAADLGLFGYLKGTVNSSFLKASDIVTDANTFTAESNAYAINETNIAESKYSCVVKNLTIKNLNASATYRRYVGALAGQAQDAYISGITVENSDIHAYKYAGGIVAWTGAVVVKDCSIDADSTVSTADHSVGGIIGGVNNGTGDYACAVLNCTNAAPVSGSTYVGGIIGHASDNGGLRFVVSECSNSGTVTGTSGLVGGIVGGGGPHGWGDFNKLGTEATFIGNCTNSGSIVAGSSDTSANKVGGIIGEFFGQMYNCSNSGSVSGYASYMAGICGGISNYGDCYLTNVSNSGTITNNKSGANTYSLLSHTSGVVYVNGTTVETLAGIEGNTISND